MKTMRGKRILTACLTAILLMSALPVLALPTGAASYVKSIQNGTGTRSAESIYAPFSYRVNVLGEFTAFGFADMDTGRLSVPPVAVPVVGHLRGHPEAGADCDQGL